MAKTSPCLTFWTAKLLIFHAARPKVVTTSLCRRSSVEAQGGPDRVPLALLVHG